MKTRKIKCLAVKAGRERLALSLDRRLREFRFRASQWESGNQTKRKINKINCMILGIINTLSKQENFHVLHSRWKRVKTFLGLHVEDHVANAWRQI